MKQRESVNELVKAEKGLLRVAQLNSLTTFYCPNIQGQFSPLPLAFLF